MHTSTTSTARLDAWHSVELQQATQGKWLNDILPTQPVQRIITDSRQAQCGDVFLALKGERFDAHDFIQDVVTRGVCAVIVQHDIPQIDIPQLIVEDTRLALGHLGAYRRQQCQNLKVIALTGSSGKTTTKEMLGSIFSQLGETLITRGNLNNDLGVPMMLLELRQDHHYAVFELGASHQGEIDYTAQLVQPDVAGVINIGTAHLGEFGGRSGICQAKAEIYSHIKPDGIAIIPQADDFVDALSQAAQKFKQISFGQHGDVYAKNIQLSTQSSTFDLVTPQGEIDIHLPFAGEHNVYNAEAAASFALALGIDVETIKIGLQSAIGAKGRLNFIHKKQYTLIDDTYNANPTSMRSAADVLCQQESQIKIMVIGDIGELGAESAQQHFLLGQDLAKKNIDCLIAIGEFAENTIAGANSSHAKAFQQQQQALVFLQDYIRHHQSERISFLFKGSRYTHMETVLNALLESL